MWIDTVYKGESDNNNNNNNKVEAIPLQALTSPEISKALRLPYFKTIGT
jgi:hypothetical protein